MLLPGYGCYRALFAGVQAEEVDEDNNFDNCPLCGLGGNLVCCDACPAAFHLRCIGEGTKTIPDGEWLCAECSMGSRGEPVLKCAEGRRVHRRNKQCVRCVVMTVTITFMII